MLSQFNIVGDGTRFKDAITALTEPDTEVWVDLVTPTSRKLEGYLISSWGMIRKKGSKTCYKFAYDSVMNRDGMLDDVKLQVASDKLPAKLTKAMGNATIPVLTYLSFFKDADIAVAPSEVYFKNPAEMGSNPYRLNNLTLEYTGFKEDINSVVNFLGSDDYWSHSFNGSAPVDLHKNRMYYTLTQFTQAHIACSEHVCKVYNSAWEKQWNLDNMFFNPEWSVYTWDNEQEKWCDNNTVSLPTSEKLALLALDDNKYRVAGNVDYTSFMEEPNPKWGGMTFKQVEGIYRSPANLVLRLLGIRIDLLHPPKYWVLERDDTTRVIFEGIAALINGIDLMADRFILEDNKVQRRLRSIYYSLYPEDELPNGILYQDISELEFYRYLTEPNENTIDLKVAENTVCRFELSALCKKMGIMVNEDSFNALRDFFIREKLVSADAPTKVDMGVGGYSFYIYLRDDIERSGAFDYLWQLAKAWNEPEPIKMLAEVSDKPQIFGYYFRPD